MARYRFIEEREIVEDSLETSNETTNNKHECSETKQITMSTLYEMGDHFTAVEIGMAASSSSRGKSLPLTTVVEITIVHNVHNVPTHCWKPVQLYCVHTVQLNCSPLYKLF